MNPSRTKNRSQVPLAMGDPFTLNYDELGAVGLIRAIQLHLERFRGELFFEKTTDWGDERGISVAIVPSR